MERISSGQCLIAEFRDHDNEPPGCMKPENVDCRIAQPLKEAPVQQN